jgi:hypothetical protein
MKQSQQVLQQQYKERKCAQLLLSSDVFPQFVQTYRTEIQSLELDVPTEVQKPTSLTAFLSFRGKSKATPQTNNLTEMLEVSRSHLQMLDKFAPNGFVDSSSLQKLAKTQDDLIMELYPNGTKYADNKHVSYGLLGVLLIGLSKFVLSRVSLKVAGIGFLAGTALCVGAALLYCCRGKKPTYDLDGQVVSEATKIDQEIRDTLSIINAPMDSGSSLMQEVSPDTTINNIKLCQQVYNEKYLPAMQLARNGVAHGALLG